MFSMHLIKGTDLIVKPLELNTLEILSLLCVTFCFDHDQ